MELISQLANEFHIREEQAKNAVSLLDEGNTVPFIARYRKELTGSLDDQVLRELAERVGYLRNLQARKEEVASTIEGLGAMNEELARQLAAAKTLAKVEDLYRPYKPKRKTRASVAKEKGLEPLALRLLEQDPAGPLPEELAADFVDEQKGVASPKEALDGACDIIAEQISDHALLRGELRERMLRDGVLCAKGDPETPSVYEQYYDYREPVAKIAGHRVLAVDRGEREKLLKISVELDRETALTIVGKYFYRAKGGYRELMNHCVQDAYDRLLFPSLEREVRNILTENADAGAIKVFGLNLRHLLMQPPLKNCAVMGFDPAYRTGCKIAVVDKTGKVLQTTVVYPTPPQNKVAESKAVLKKLIETYHVTAIAVGNGTASKESEIFIADLLKEISGDVAYMMVSEAGASVYSASKLGAEEFPDYDVSLRSAVSIARRLQDPLAELVKIDPKAIGVGQYQHDMPKAQLDEALGGVVESCVNSVGVDLNTSSQSLLSYVSGVNTAIAKNIVAYREENGGFPDRKTLLKVPKLGKKAYEQCAGFLRVPESAELLDNTAVHPESYAAAKELLRLCGYADGTKGLTRADLAQAAERARQIGVEKLSDQLKLGLPTLQDILDELVKPGRDPRDELPPPLLRKDVMDLNDLKPDMILDGTVRNVTDFGVFVDIAVHQDGLVHISQICDRFIQHPSQVLKVGDVVKVRVLSVDVSKKRISLSMKGLNPQYS